MILLSFLGTGQYQETCYTWKNKEYKTAYVVDALGEFFQPEKIKVFVTKESQEQHWEKLKESINNRFHLEPILIPSGKKEEEIWQIFDQVVDSVGANEKVIFDITHAFRSLPLIVLLASAFLQKARNVTIEGVYYGAFDANREKPPIFELTPAIKLLDWLTATDTFINTGSAQQLGQLLAQIQIDFFKSGQVQEQNFRPNTLRKFGDRISRISQNIEFIRPMELLEECHGLNNFSQERLQEEIGILAKPFSLLLEQIEADYAQFSVENPREADPNLIIKKHFLLIKWYVQKDLKTQGILLAREWVVTTLAILKNSNYLQRGNRKIIEDQLNDMASEQKYEQDITKYVENPQQLANIWSQLGEYRNDLAHCEMRYNSLSVNRLDKYAQELPDKLKNLFPSLNLD